MLELATPISTTRSQLVRQVHHWTLAAFRLENLDDLAAPEAWNRLERYLGVSLRQYLKGVVERLKRQARLLQASLDAAENSQALSALQRHLLLFRRQYLRAETTLNFFSDAVNTRSNPTLAGQLKACDILAYRCMAEILEPLGKAVPQVLTYADNGAGASMLKAGLRLWDGGKENPVAAIKITRHNLLRPTALIHEAGHQVAHNCDWNRELKAVLASGLRGDAGIAGVWSSWASEIAADAIAFVYTGYASTAALHDVVAGEPAYVYHYTPGDPHPVSFIRVLLAVEMCRYCYGAGPWDGLAEAWVKSYPMEAAGRSTPLLEKSIPLLGDVVRLTLDSPMRAFGGRKLIALVNPERVKPDRLEEMETRLGAALYTSMHWVWTEALRLLALTGLRIATMPARSAEILKRQEEWMLRLGGALQAA